MNLKQAIENLGNEAATEFVKQYAEMEALNWDDDLRYVWLAILSNINLASTRPYKKDNEEGVIHRWVIKYKKAYENRPSNRRSKASSTKPDPMLDYMINARLKKLSEKQVELIKYAHRLQMSAENLLGLFLEEYLSVELKAEGWHCAWGETIKAVDFVHQDGRLLQIKNRDNTENSSSKAIRDGTNIKEWHRIKSQKVEYCWEKLNSICGTKHLSEEGFCRFVQTCITQNPDCFHIEESNPWGEGATD